MRAAEQAGPRVGRSSPAPSNNDGDLVLEDRFAIVPEWLLDAEIGDAAVRLYAVLLRFGQSSGSRMPSRSTLARRLRKRSTDSVDRAMRELVEVGAVRVEHRYQRAQRLTNAYHLRTSRPGRGDAPAPPKAGSRNSAATPTGPAGGGRTDATGVAADSGHDPEHLTQSTTSSTSGTRSGDPSAEAEVAAECGIDDWDGFVAEIGLLRRQVGGPVTRWAGPCLAAAIQLATRGRGWPPTRTVQALRRVAADPATRSPMRVAEAGPWWDETPSPSTTRDLAGWELALTEAGGARVALQRRAREELRAEGLPITRDAVTRRAHQLLSEQTGTAG